MTLVNKENMLGANLNTFSWLRLYMKYLKNELR